MKKINTRSWVTKRDLVTGEKTEWDQESLWEIAGERVEVRLHVDIKRPAVDNTYGISRLYDRTARVWKRIAHLPMSLMASIQLKDGEVEERNAAEDERKLVELTAHILQDPTVCESR